METLSPSATTFNITGKFSRKIQLQASNFFQSTVAFPTPFNNKYNNYLLSPPPSSSICCVSSPSSRARSAVPASATSSALSLSASVGAQQRHWMVQMEAPPIEFPSKDEIIDYYVKTLETVLGSEKDAQMCIYDASLDSPFGFCCDVDAEASRELSGLQGVLAVKPDPDFSSAKKDYGLSNNQLGNMSISKIGSPELFPAGNSKHWLVQMDRPTVGVVTKAQMVDFYAQILTKVLGNEQDAQMCIYHISWQSNYGFCCVLDEECARELAGVPGVLSVRPDENFESSNKDYGGASLHNSRDSLDSTEANQPINIKTKKLFVTGLSFYTSEKTLRTAFEGFGELVEVKIIMDKISKRSKGYAFIEYTTEEAANAALKEMNGKIINGWMIVVDVAKPTPQKYSRSPRRAV